MDAHHDLLTRRGHYRFHFAPDISVHSALQAGVALDDLPDGGERRLVIGTGIDADPNLPRFDVDDLISGHRTASMGCDTQDSGNLPQLVAGSGHDPVHLRKGRAGSPHPGDPDVPFLERGKQRPA